MAQRFWVGDGGSMSDTAHWSTSSGGAGGASVPGSTTDVVFDANSFTLANQTVLFNPASYMILKSIDWTGVTNNPTWQWGDDTSSPTMYLHDNFTLGANMTVVNYTSSSYGLYLYSGTTVFTSNGTNFPVSVYGATDNIFELGDDCSFISDRPTYPTYPDSYDQGGFLRLKKIDTKGFDLSANYISASAYGLTNNWAGSTITVTRYLVMSLNDTTDANTHVNMEGTRSCKFYGGGNTIGNITVTGKPQIGFGDYNHFRVNNITCNNLTKICVAGEIQTGFDLNATITGTLTLKGYSETQRLFVGYAFIGYQQEISAAAVDLEYVDFQDCLLTGATTWSGTSVGDAGNNTGLTPTTPVTRYWVGGGGNFSDTSHWSDSSGGVGGSSVPLCHDTIIFDENSVLTAGQTINFDVPVIGNLTISGVENDPTINFEYSYTDPEFMAVGNFILQDGLTYTDNFEALILAPRKPAIFTPASWEPGIEVLSTSTDWDVDTGELGAGRITLGSDLVMTATAAIQYYGGHLDFNDYDVTVGALWADEWQPGDWYWGDGTITLTGDNDNPWTGILLDIEGLGTNKVDWELNLETEESTLVIDVNSDAFRTIYFYGYGSETEKVEINKIQVTGTTPASANCIMEFNFYAWDNPAEITTFEVLQPSIPRDIQIEDIGLGGQYPNIFTNFIYRGEVGQTASILRSSSISSTADLQITNPNIRFIHLKWIEGVTPIRVNDCTDDGNNVNIIFGTLYSHGSADMRSNQQSHPKALDSQTNDMRSMQQSHPKALDSGDNKMRSNHQSHPIALDDDSVL